MPNCLICDSQYDPFMTFGEMPIANNFLPPEDFDTEFFYELALGVCPNCKMVQLVNQPPKEMMFHDFYAYFSSTSKLQQIHFKKYSEYILKRYCDDKDPFVVEIGCNDGILLKNFAATGLRHLGVEPSRNVATEARRNGVNTVCEFFDRDLATTIVSEKGKADAIMAANVMCHIPYIHSVLEGVRLLLKPKGVFVFEDPYLGDIVEKTAYDQIYDEHVFYFSLTSVQHLAELHGLEVIDVLPLDVHGGSMRYILSLKGERDITSFVGEVKKRESQLGLHTDTTFNYFKARIEASKTNLLVLLTKIRDDHKRIVGYGATSKSTTVTNYCGIGPDLIEFISDTTPGKQGKYNPGSHIPIKPYESFIGEYPDYALLFAWNHSNEIMAKETAFNNAGGQWITYVPEVRVSK